MNFPTANLDIARHLRIWRQMALMSLLAQLSYGLGSLGFLAGKLIRLFFFLAYLAAIFRHTDSLLGYSAAQTVIFFLTFNLVDMVAMVFFRSVYSVRRVIQEGDLDYYLTQPCSALFRVATSYVDALDLLSLLPVIALLAWFGPQLPVALGPRQLALYLLLLFNGIAIALAMHIIVASIAVRTQELENTIWIYRDMMFLGKFPMDVYAVPMQWALTLVIPIGVMVSFPAKALLGLLHPMWILYALALAAALMGASLWLWRNSIRAYTSVSC